MAKSFLVGFQSLTKSKRCGIDHVRKSVHRKIDFWHACTLFAVLQKASLSFVAPLHRRCILIQRKSIKLFLTKLVKLILGTPVLAITGTADDKTQDVIIRELALKHVIKYTNEKTY